MSLIVAENLGKYYGGHDVFAGISVRVEPGDRIGLVGPNGGGKSTLLRVLAGLEAPTAGKVAHRPGLRVGYLPQHPPDLSGQTLWDMMLEAVADLQRMEQELLLLAERMADGDEAAAQAFAALQEDFERRGGYTYEARVRQVLAGLGFTPNDYAVPVAHLSGGQRARALLARLLLEEPDVLLLDEPTNHLDLEALEWLENWLESFQGSVVVVAHDRYFLDKVANRIWELAFGRLETYRGNYSAYVRQREERFRARLKEWEQQQEFIRRTEEFIRRNIAGQRSREARGRRTRLQRFLETEAIEKPKTLQRVRIRLHPRFASGEIVWETRNLVVGYHPDRPLVRVPDLVVRRGDRVAVVGPNGAGKTTLLRTLVGELPPLAGAVRTGTGVRIGYISQTHAELDPVMSVLDVIRTARRHIEDEAARSLLAQFLFRGDDVFKHVRDLSGGERTRLLLARLALQGPNTLVLDEPTNHLDIPSQEVLQEALQGFEGTILFVTHDRYLVETLATQVWAVEDGELHPIQGGWDAYVRWRDLRRERERVADRDVPRDTAWEERRAARRARKAQERRQQLREEVEQRIARMEERLAQLEQAVSAASLAGDIERVRQLSEEYEAVAQRLNALWAEWERLAD